MKQYDNITILAIETSCDDTCISILKIKNKKLEILSNFVSSQVEIHKKYGGVYPTMAKREHQKNLLPVLKKAFKKAGIKNFIKPKIDFIAVTIGPGLEPCLWTGVNFAKALAHLWNLKIIPVNHIEAHIFANFLPQIREKSKIPNSKQIFPAICLVVSGGHTQLILMKDFGKYKNHASLRSAEPCFLPSVEYKILGETRDDAAGECFDKTARILGLGYPGGPAIAEFARQWKSKIHPVKSFAGSKRKSEILFNRVKLPRPMIFSKDYDFSFSGLKTAVLYAVKGNPPSASRRSGYIQAMSAEIQQAVIDVLIKKTIKSAKDYKVKTIILGGGVTANEELRKQFKKLCLRSGLKHLVPAKKFCTDNAAMIAITAYFHKEKAKNWKNIKVDANLRTN